MWTLWLCWAWSLHSEKCSVYDVVSLLCDGYIKAENAWAGQIWQELQRRKHTVEREKPSIMDS